jgi:dihydrolipoamide dehydrogenase
MLQTAATSLTADVVVVGGGPGGYTVAARCAEYGLTTVLVERATLGGTCLTVGCIPSKALIHVAEQFTATRRAASAHLGIVTEFEATLNWPGVMSWKDGVVERLARGVDGMVRDAGVQVIVGQATVRDATTLDVETRDGTVVVTGRQLVLATGSVPAELDVLPVGGRVVNSTGLLSLESRPNSLVVVGAGYIGIELGTAMAKLGTTVTVVDVAERVLPQFEALLVRPILRRLRDVGVEVMTSTAVVGQDDAGVVVRSADGVTRSLAADAVLVAVGRRPAVNGWGLERLGLARDGQFVSVDERCRTSVAGVYAVGDLTGEPMLAHQAAAQGELVAAVVAGQRHRWDVRAMPAVCFTDPELVSVGLTADAARNRGLTVLTGTASFAANGRALTLDRDDGVVQVVARADNGQVVGIHACGDRVSELAAGYALAIETSCTVDDLCLTVAPHPTLSETLHEAARRAGAASPRPHATPGGSS